MKIKLLFLGLFCATVAFGQMQNLENLAEGKMVYGSILYDSNSKVYGYFYLFERDKNKEKKTMEYVFLDKNLNKASNNTFTCNSYNESNFEYIGIKSIYADCTLMGDYVILNKFFYYYGVMGNIFVPLVSSFQMISLKDKTVSAEFKYENGTFTELPLDGSQLKKENKKTQIKYMISACNKGDNKGFFITQEDMSGQNFKEKDLKFFDENRNLKWTYTYNPDGTNKDYRTSSILYSNNNNIYFLEIWQRKGKAKEYHIVCLDFQTGRKKYDYLFENENSRFSHTLRVKEVKGQLVLAGNYSEYNKDKEFELDKNLGFFKIILDTLGKEQVHTYSKWSDFKGAIDVDERGRVEKDFRLRPTKFFFLEDGTISILTEKFKAQSLGVWLPIPIVGSIVQAATASGEKSTDFVLFNMNKDFASNSVKTIKKQFTEAYGGTYDYLFSQYINDDNGAVFFYKDFVKKKDSKEQKEDQWILGINSIINGELTEEKIPISSKKNYTIEPMPAKEGYILLREYNKKEKYDQIRLEKLNY